MDKNPYASSDAQSFAPSDSMATHNDPVAVMIPLHNAKGWLKLLGITNIVLGVLYCLTIIGIVVGWLPIWMGILLNNASSNLEAGVRDANPSQLRQASSNLATFFTILGVLILINLIIMAIYICLVLVVLVIGLVGAANA